MKIRHIGHVKYPPVTIEPSTSTHDFHELIYVFHGQYRVEVNDALLELSPSELIIYPKGQSHWPKPLFTGSHIMVLQWDDDAYSPAGCPRWKDPHKRIEVILNWIWSTFPGTHEGVDQLHQDLLSTILMAIDTPELSQTTLAQDIASYLEKVIHDDVSMSELSQFTDMTERHLTRIFSAAYGLTPMNYLARHRAGNAVTLLTTTDETIESIARQTFFTNAQALTRAIKKFYGCSPSVIRRDGIPKLDKPA